MKILAISFENLNSLRGKWTINLEDPAYTSGGIFAITGKTGAGKTTIFDAICLALYSQTPRLGKIQGSINEIMSKHTRECGASVKFEAYGKNYQCDWSQHKDRSGNVTKHVIYCDGKSLNESTNRRETIELVTKITGMDFKRFVHAMLLEQGAFDKFLNADKNDRAEVLELITGTEIYSEISQRIYRRSGFEKQNLELKRTALESEKTRFDGLSEKNLKEEISKTNDEISRIEAELKLTAELLAWYKEIEQLNNNFRQAQFNIQTQEKRLQLFEPNRKILEAAGRAADLEGEYKLLTSKRDAKADAENNNAVLSKKISSQESERSKIIGELPGLSEELSKLRGSITDEPQVVLNRIATAMNDYVRHESDIKKAEAALKDAQKALANARSASSRAISEGKSARSELNNANNRHREILDEIMEMRARTSEAVLDEERAKLVAGMPCPLCGSTVHTKRAHGGEKADELFRKTEALEKNLKHAAKALELAQKNFDEAVVNWNTVSANESSASTRVSQCQDNLNEMHAKIGELQMAVSDALLPLRIAWSGDPESAFRTARDWKEKVSSLEKKVQELEGNKAVIEAGLEVLKADFEERKRSFDAMTSELDNLEASFVEKLHQKNFPDEKSFLSTRINLSEIENLKRTKDELDARTVSLKGVFENTKRQLEEKEAMKPTEEPCEKIEERSKELEAKLKALHQTKGILSQKLANVTESLEKVGKLQEEYNAQKKISSDWDNLNNLIGSAKGDKFRVIAQGVTLDLVVENANKYLEKMRGRYSLIRTPDNQELKLSVIDSEQANEIRPTSNLSGGERFIISLALALGLSQISGAKAKVDSLFIDEGFGSLDDEALNSALDALGEIKREGRMIGIISHVSGISERIRTKINVIRKNEGTSVLEGPGCSGGNKI